MLGDHPRIYAFPSEIRLIVDPGGLEELAHALSDGWTPLGTDDALRRFDVLTREIVTGQSLTSFRNWNVPGIVGPPRYWQGLAGLWKQLVQLEYDEGVPSCDATAPLRSPFEAATYHRVLGRYFADRAELIAIFREFLDGLLTGIAHDCGKQEWCEKTPLNFLSVPFLWELFPEATFIHIMRHPFGVVASYLHQPWAPATIQDVLAYLTPIYKRWFTLRDTLSDATGQLIELKMEELATDWPRQRKRLFASLGVEDAETTSRFDVDVIHQRDAQLSKQEEELVLQELGWAIERLGYEERS